MRMISLHNANLEAIPYDVLGVVSTIAIFSSPHWKLDKSTHFEN